MSTIDMTKTPLSKIDKEFSFFKERLGLNSLRELGDMLLNDTGEITRLRTNYDVQKLSYLKINGKEYAVCNYKPILKRLRARTLTKSEILYDIYCSLNGEDTKLSERIEDFLQIRGYDPDIQHISIEKRVSNAKCAVKQAEEENMGE